MKTYMTLGIILLTLAFTVHWIFNTPSPQKADASDQASTALDSSRVIITGSSTMAQAMTIMAREYEASRPGLRIEVATGGSSRGVVDVSTGMADIGMVSRRLTPTEIGLKSVVVGYDGVCLLVHSSNPVQSLTSDQVRGIFTGKIRRWSDVGGNDTPITYIHRSESHSERGQFMEFFKVRENEIRECVTVGDGGQAVTAVLGNVDAIVYVSIGISDVHNGSSSSLKLLPLNGVVPTHENIRSGKYPLMRPLNLVIKGTPHGVTNDFIEFALSPQGQECIKKEFFVPVFAD